MTFHVRVSRFMQFCIIIIGAYKINLDFCHIYIIPSYTIHRTYYIHHTTKVVYLSDSIKASLYLVFINYI